VCAVEGGALLRQERSGDGEWWGGRCGEPLDKLEKNTPHRTYPLRSPPTLWITAVFIHKIPPGA